MPLTRGSTLGPYEILSPLGSGGMGEVYKARDTRLDRVVAVKVLHAGVSADAELRERFNREARAISQLNHPHICVLHDVGEQGDTLYLVLEYLEGETLAGRLGRGALPPDQAVRIGIEICTALDAAHRNGIVHRDLKPGNVMLTRGGVKLLDFGLARRSEGVLQGRQGADSPTVAGPLTAAGTILGTVQYMSPEQVEGRPSDERSDVWSFGCLLYEMIAGAPAFGGRSSASTIAAILEHQPTPLSQRVSGVPPALDRIISACLEKDPDERWQSARDLLRQLRWAPLDTAPPGPGTPAPTVPGAAGPAPAGTVSRRVWMGFAGLVVIAAVLGGLAVWNSDRGEAPAGPPVVVLMDSTHPERVYDEETRKAGGTNADDLTDLLRDLPVLLVKEHTNALWHREDEVVRQRPALVVVHRSCFYDASLLPDPEMALTRVYPLAADKFEMFMGYVGLGNPHTKFLVYSRRSWVDDASREKWVSDVEKRFPVLKGRITAWPVPLDRATFRHATTASEIKAQVVRLLQKPAR